MKEKTLTIEMLGKLNTTHRVVGEAEEKALLLSVGELCAAGTEVGSLLSSSFVHQLSCRLPGMSLHWPLQWMDASY